MKPFIYIGILVNVSNLLFNHLFVVVLGMVRLRPLIMARLF